MIVPVNTQSPREETGTLNIREHWSGIVVDLVDSLGLMPGQKPDGGVTILPCGG